MAQVVLKINGYPYTLGCPDGQEENLQALGAELDKRVNSIKAQVGNLGEARLLVMAGIMLADELSDLRRDGAPAPAAAARPAADEAAAADALIGLARRLEGVATRLAQA
ncbi:cell division protein ZapA [Elioraea sp.]|uniref:cell division protein ZapA n=1 Tax=Elioraea sp. TaxID=2185103 RepID=UPI0025BF202F|nr:cell division protein ZapA [Elioraea sp.]